MGLPEQLYYLTSAGTKAMYVEGQLGILGDLECSENIIYFLLHAVERVSNIGVRANVGPDNFEARRNEKGSR